MPHRITETVLVVGGIAVATFAAGIGALLAAVLTPFRIGEVLIPISAAIALIVNIGCIRFAYLVTQRRWAMVGPILAWLAVVVVCSMRTPEGDLIIVDSWSGVANILAGAAALTIGAVGVMAVAAERTTETDVAKGPVTSGSTLG